MGLPVELPAPLLQLEWAAPFAGMVRTALHALKYAGERRMAGPLGEAAAERWRRVGAGGDLIVPVPVHAERARLRGYDQADLVAAVIATRLSLPRAPILERQRRTVAQFDLDRAHRGTNVAGAFRLKNGGRGALDLRGRWVILVDDVTTTGATLAACADVLMDAGALAVSGLTIARER
jgi:ComF family protein